MQALTEAIMFFRDDRVVKEMFYTEFEAVLDDVVGIPDFSGEHLQACFIQISQRLKIVGAVFFTIQFDRTGRVGRGWNIPLRHLLDQASFGPDLGEGPARVACRSACPVSWYRDQLWDPIMQGEGTFDELNRAVQRNRLGIIADQGSQHGPKLGVSSFFSQQASPEQNVDGAVSEGEPVVAAEPAVHEPSAHLEPSAHSQPPAQPPTVAAPQSCFNRRYREKLTAIRGAERLRFATQAEHFEREIADLEDRHSEALAQREAVIAELKTRLSDSAQERDRLSAKLDKQSRWLEEKQREIEAHVHDAGDARLESEIATLKESYEEELQKQLKDQAGQYEESIAKREEEIYQRVMEVVELRSELGELRTQNRQLMLNSDKHLLDDMCQKGLSFVAYHPGIEHLVITRDELPDYLRDPIAFAAQRCRVDIELYQAWLLHYRLPICRYCDSDGEVCGQPVAKVKRPSLFRPGENDRCQQHMASLN